MALLYNQGCHLEGCVIFFLTYCEWICQSSLLSVWRLELEISQPQCSALTTTPWDTLWWGNNEELSWDSVSNLIMLDRGAWDSYSCYTNVSQPTLWRLRSVTMANQSKRQTQIILPGPVNSWKVEYFLSFPNDITSLVQFQTSVAGVLLQHWFQGGLRFT